LRTSFFRKKRIASDTHVSIQNVAVWEWETIKEIVLRWPVARQILAGGDGTGPEAMSAQTENLFPKNHGADVARSVCPYCAVGCGQLAFHKNGKLISIEGDP